MTSELKKLLEAANAHPFLFVGSGFTHRYLGTADWKGLVTHFANQAKPGIDFPFEWYKNEVAATGRTADPDLPAITQLVEKDFARLFLSEESFRNLRTRHEAAIRAGVSPLKIGVADLLSAQEAGFSTPNHAEEISAMGHARKNVAGVITTNFDRFLGTFSPSTSLTSGRTSCCSIRATESAKYTKSTDASRNHLRWCSPRRIMCRMRAGTHTSPRSS